MLVLIINKGNWIPHYLITSTRLLLHHYYTNHTFHTDTMENIGARSGFCDTNEFRGRILFGIDVESVSPSNYKGTISVGLAAIDQLTFRVLLKKTIFLPFHVSQLDHKCKTEFWDKNPDIYNLHVTESINLGYDPYSTTVPSFYEFGTEYWTCMKKQVQLIEDCIADFQKELERMGDKRVIEFWTDNIFDYISVSTLLSDFIGGHPLQERRLLNGEYQGWPRLVCHNSDSQLSCLSPEHIFAKIYWVSTDSVFTHLGLTYPDNTPPHNHEPSNDALRTIIEVACVYNYFLGCS